jgi:hypothetical protein
MFHFVTTLILIISIVITSNIYNKITPVNTLIQAPNIYAYFSSLYPISLKRIKPTINKAHPEQNIKIKNKF